MVREPTLDALYLQLKGEARTSLGSDTVARLLARITVASHDFLRLSTDVVELESEVPGKTYFSFRKKSRLSRPINKALYVSDAAELRDRLTLLENGRLDHLQGSEATRTIYTLAMAFCAMNDSTKVGDKKTPATYFEILIGHLLALHLGVKPTNAIEVLSGDLKGSLPTDFIFDLGHRKAKFHVPIKLSTRERVIQVWAHQRIVNGVYGAGRYKGLLVVLAETKLDTKRLEVVEICLPDQWRVYQMFIAQLTRIYYFDVPVRYADLGTGYPKIEVKPFGQFFSEADLL